MTPFILASGSSSRAQLLRAAGVPFSVQPAQIETQSIVVLSSPWSLIA